MKLNLKKIDLSGVKEYLFQKGERIGLAVCGVIAVVLIGLGLLKATGASKDYAALVRSSHTAKSNAINVQSVIDPEAPAPKPEPIAEVWKEVVRPFESTPYIIAADQGESRRLNPQILTPPIVDASTRLISSKHIQLDLLRGGYFSYDVDTRQKKVSAFRGDKGAGPAVGPGGAAAGQAARLVKIVKPRRILLVSAVFPMKDQVEEFRKALRLAVAAEVLANPENRVTPVGLNVYRCEIDSSGKAGEWLPLYKYEPATDKLTIAAPIDNMLREAMIDEENLVLWTPYLLRGLATPLPQLANLKLPKLKLEGIPLGEGDEPDPGVKPPPGGEQGPKQKLIVPGVRPKMENPGGGAPDQEEFKFDSVSWAKVGNKELVDKFTGVIDFFDPAGLAMDPTGAVGPGAPIPPRPAFQPKGGGEGVGPKGGGEIGPKGGLPVAPGAADPATAITDVLLRFVDADVEPGKSYRYSIQVRMANPNYKRKDVAFQALAVPKELLSPFAITPEIKVPGELFVYATDQRPDKTIPKGSDIKEAASDAPYGNWTTPIQVHRWVPRITEADQNVGEWAIAERLLVRRGDTLGRRDVMVEVPIWHKGKEVFEIGFVPQAAAKVDPKKAAQRADTGIPIHFVVDNPPPLLVDFEGGVKKNVKIGTVNVLKDESAADLLILTPEGKLVVRNQRIDSDNKFDAGKQREERVEAWRQRLNEVRRQLSGPSGIAMPKAGGS